MKIYEWKYKVKGRRLRKAIKRRKGTEIECIISIYEEILACLNSLKEQLEKDDREEWENKIELIIEEVKNAIPDAGNQTVSCELETNRLNIHLNAFFLLCDQLRAWVTLLV